MTGIAKRLEKSGFIVRKNDPSDDRVKWMQITPEGVQVLRAISDYKEQDLTKYLREYSDKEKSALLESLQAILKQARSKQNHSSAIFESEEQFLASMDVS
jgi:DNA-binding MarR family transcriptional regulator